CLLAAVGVGKTLRDDMTKGMMPTIMSRPVPPSALIVGKWAGVVCSILLVVFTATTSCLWSTRIIHYRLRLESLGLTAYFAVFALALLLPAVRHYLKGGNYIWQANVALAVLFPVAFVVLNFFGYNGEAEAAFGSLVDWRTAYSFAYIALPLLVYTAIVVFLATQMDVSLLMVCAAILFFGGLFSAYLVNLLIPSETVKSIVWIFIPNLQLYWIPDDIPPSTLASSGYLLPRLVNAVFKSVLFLLFATASFKRLEIKGSI
ncbi:MAG: hypothetical protein GXP32_08485, partial [Kiritimatiellaeota bacterium]|nr:hypothetical protein [Kiritimatiellota bacterium]